MTQNRQASRSAMARLLKQIKRSRQAVLVEDCDKVAARRAKKEGFVFVSPTELAPNEGIDIREPSRLHITVDGEEFLKRWRWRWWRYAALVGGLVVTADSALSLIGQTWQPCPKEDAVVQSSEEADGQAE